MPARAFLCAVLLLAAYAPPACAGSKDEIVAHQENHLSGEGGYNGGVRDVHGAAARASIASLASDTGVPSMSAADMDVAAPANRDLSHLSVLQRVKPEDVKLFPYPHIVLKDALPKHIFDHLAAHYPDERTLFSISRAMSPTKFTPKLMKPNFRYDIRSAQTLVNKNSIDPMWVDFVSYHISPAFYQDVVRVFGAALEKWRPDFVATGSEHSLLNKKTTMRYAQDANTDMTMDCQVGMNSPVSRKSSVRGPHHDTPGEVYAGLLYFRDARDKSTGGDLQVLSCKGDKCLEVPEGEKRKRGMSTARNHEHFDYRDLKVEATAKYGANTLVWFINTFDSVHAVTPRQPTTFSRRLVNFVAEMVKRDAQGHVIIKPNNAAKLAGKHN